MPFSRLAFVPLGCALLLSGCADAHDVNRTPDGSVGAHDADAALPLDGATSSDASPAVDAATDATTLPDVGPIDAGPEDASVADTGQPKDAIEPDLTATWDDVQPILQQKCGSFFCHGSWASSYDQLKEIVSKPICNYEGRFIERFDCSLRLIEAGGMPRARGCDGDPYLDEGKSGCLTVDELATFRGWVAMGAPP